MWSGPRNISTAMMRAWENRPDTIVCDEPLYAHYLKETGAPHPGAQLVIAAYETDWKKVVHKLTGEIENGASIYFQKHMTHHLLPNMDKSWLDDLTNCFLIREPREMLTSLIKVIPNPTIEDTGLTQQIELFKHVSQRTKTTPPVLDARQVLENPRQALGMLCEATNIEFDEAMLEWPAGSRETDGIWEKFWYERIATTTSFCSYASKEEEVPEHLLSLLDQCNALYAWIFEQRLQ